MRKLIDVINEGSVEFGKKYYLNDFDGNDIREYFIFLFKMNFFIK